MASLAIALFAPYLPAPAVSGGRIRIHRLAACLTEIGEVELFAATGRRELARAGNSAELGQYARVHTASAWLGDLPGLRRPARVRAAGPPALARAFRAAHRARPFDVIVVEHSHAASVALGAGLPWVLDEHNIESEYVAARAAAAGKTGFLQRREVEGLVRWERALWRAADEVVCVSSADAAHVEGVRGRAPALVPNGVALADVTFTLPSARSGAEVLFVGSMAHPPNVVAARFLAEQVMPLVRRELAESRLILCGANPAPEVQALAGPEVEVTGTVPSVAPYLARAAVYANALSHGAGTSLKVLEALAAGLPLVSTAVGVRGFALTAPEHFLAAEDAEGFAHAIVRSIRDRGARDEAARRGRELAADYDWAELGRRFAEIVERAARGRSRERQRNPGICA